MRPLTVLAACLALLFAAPGAALASASEEGLLVFDTVGLIGADSRAMQADGTTGQPGTAGECDDPSFRFAGPRWKKFERYYVNAASAPAGLNRTALVQDLVAAHEAWEAPFATDCPRPAGESEYTALFGGLTRRTASLVATGSADGVNAVAFISLAGTACDGAAACVVIDYEKGRIREADLALEKDLTRYGFQDFWTTDDTTSFDAVGGDWAVVDVATHEFGHFAGLDHVDSPALTMFSYVHDGAQTLGLGDMLGILARY